MDEINQFVDEHDGWWRHGSVLRIPEDDIAEFYEGWGERGLGVGYHTNPLGLSGGMYSIEIHKIG